MYHYGWLWEELTLLSELYADVMDVNHCNSANFEEWPVQKLCFFDFVVVHRGPWVDEAIRLQNTNASTVLPENVAYVPQIGTALEAMQVWKDKQFTRFETLLLWLSLR